MPCMEILIPPIIQAAVRQRIKLDSYPVLVEEHGRVRNVLVFQDEIIYTGNVLQFSLMYHADCGCKDQKKKKSL